MYADRVYETSSTSGTSAFSLSGAFTGFRTFAAAFGSASAYYVIVNRSNPAEWEVGSFAVSGATLNRIAANVLSGSSGAGVLVNFSAGVKDIFNAPPASQYSAWSSSVPAGKVDRTGDAMTGNLRGVGGSAAATGFQINNGTDLGALFAPTTHGHNQVQWSGSYTGDNANPGGTTPVFVWTGAGWVFNRSTNCACACDCNCNCNCNCCGP